MLIFLSLLKILLGPGSTAGGMGLPPGYPAPQQHRS